MGFSNLDARSLTNVVQEIKAYGRALDPRLLVISLSEFAAAQVAFMASKQEFERLQTLSQQNNASARALLSAEAAAKREQLATVLLGGLITSTALDLVVLPTLAWRYGRFEGAENRASS